MRSFRHARGRATSRPFWPSTSMRWRGNGHLRPRSGCQARFLEMTGRDVPQFEDYRRLLEEAEIDAVALTDRITPTSRWRWPPPDSAGTCSVRRPWRPRCRIAGKWCVPARVPGFALMVGHKRRLRPPWARMIQLRELLGPVHAMSTIGYFDARQDGFQGLVDPAGRERRRAGLLGVHELDWMRAMCGDVVAVSAVCGPGIDSRYDFSDSIHVLLRFQHGSDRLLGVSLSYPLTRYRQVYGADGRLQPGRNAVGHLISARRPLLEAADGIRRAS